MAVNTIDYPSIGEREARGDDASTRTPPSSHTGWEPAADRPDPVALPEEQDRAREPDLVPVRHGRMMISPFTFYRGAAKIMAADLKDTPTTGLVAQLCGDAHLSNFGAFASPERRLLFDLNDFDETLPGPFEYDVMDVWYAHLDEDELMRAVHGALAEIAEEAKKGPKKARKQAKQQTKAARKAEKNALKASAKARTRDSLQALSKLGELVDGRYRIVSQPPIVIPARDLAAAAGVSSSEVDQLVRDQFRAYRATLRDDQRRLLERFHIVDMARKGVGSVGSVGTLAFIVLLQGRDAQEPPVLADQGGDALGP
jgi:Uncharacterized protein conserved in bacteria (DUF2252)